MSERGQSPSTAPSSPPSSGDSDVESEESDHTPTEPAYSVQEIVDVFVDFYTFLKTIHFQDVNLKMPPPSGWPNIVESVTHKSERVYEVIRRLPYFDDAPEALLHYNSRFLDYTRMSLRDVDEAFDLMDQVIRGFHYTERREMDIDDFSDTFPFSSGFETGGRSMYLNVFDGEVSEDSCLLDLASPVDIRTYFDSLREDFEKLSLIPCYNRSVIEAQNVGEHTRAITEEQIAAQTEEWGTDLDVQYIRQLYRSFGWPHAFRKDEAIRAVDELMAKIKESRGEWPFIFGFGEGMHYHTDSCCR